MKPLAIDLRMYQMSGIGRYLQLLLPNLLPRLDATQISVLGNRSVLSSQTWASDPRIRVIAHNASIFSIREQLSAVTPLIGGAPVLWSPQFNFPLLYRGKLIVTIHDLCQLSHPETLRNSIQRTYSRYLITQAVSRAEAVLCVSDFTASEIQRMLQVDPARLTVTYPELDDFSAPPPRAMNASESQRPYFLTVGNVKKHKNLGTLIAAFKLIQHQIPHDLIIVGKREGFLNSDTDLSTKGNLEAGRIKFTGFVSEETLRTYYRNAEALIFPSFYEGFGFPIVEAMAQGCPVACSNVSSLPEVAGDAALLFDPFCTEELAGTLLRMSSDSVLRKDLTQRGFARLSELQAQSGAEKTAAVINSICNERHSSSSR